MRDLELVIFDMAGTTIEARGQVPDALTAALAEHGVNATREQVKAVRGASKREALLRLIPAGPAHAQRAEAAYASFRVHLARLYAAEGVRAIPGATSAFRSLRERGVRVALNTGSDREATALLLGALGGGAGIVDAIASAEDLDQGRPV